MEESFLARKNLDECSEFEDGNDLSVVNLSDLRLCADALDPVVGLLHCLSVIGGDVHDALSVNLVDGNDCTGLSLDLLDGLSALADDCPDEVLVDFEGLDSRNERLVVLARGVDGLHHLTHDVEPSQTGLLKCLFENLV